MYIYDNTSLSSPEKKKCFRQKLMRKSKYILSSVTLPKIVPLKNIAKPDRPQMTIHVGHFKSSAHCRFSL
jgi:hypothetical protein